jgi:glucosamine--fructose-6-phosphate aminotransferase (isomerizing)
MCGIIGILSNKNIIKEIISGLKKLEYRGYDSSGISYIKNNSITTLKSVGKIKNLELILDQDKEDSALAIAHTRWATHGVVNSNNAHPHANEYVSVVHNGIIENYQELKEILKSNGYNFVTQTDTEVIVSLITEFCKQGLKPLECVQKTTKLLNGSYSIAILFNNYQDRILCARNGSPLAIGISNDKMSVGSDAIALLDIADKIIYLEHNDIAEITNNTYSIFNNNQQVTRQECLNPIIEYNICKGNFEHYMLKEIHESPYVIKNIMNNYSNFILNNINSFGCIKRIILIGCGTAYYAGFCAKYIIEDLLNIEVSIEIASEFRYKQQKIRGLNSETLAVFISQSGETADTIGCLDICKNLGYKTLGIVNVPTSTLARSVDIAMMTYAGFEIGVASTKAFIAQILVLSLFANNINYAITGIFNKINHEAIESKVNNSISKNIINKIESMSKLLVSAKSVLYMGRLIAYPLALEGALKFKEVTYIPSEGYPTGEMKHGPIALLDEGVSCIFIAPYDDLLFFKTISNIQECKTRGAKIFIITDEFGLDYVKDLTDIENTIVVSNATNNTEIALIYSPILQLIAYYTALYKGTDVDQPRNLAKSVTVE